MQRVDGLLIVDKQQGVTSHDVVARARRALQTRRIGHTGTLDPPATGVLVLAVGEATKLVSHLTVSDKEYEAEIALGVETDTLDAAGAVIARAEVPAFDAAQLQAAIDQLTGPQLQEPPQVSAIKVQGKRLYKQARQGLNTEVPSRPVQLHEARIRAFDHTEVQVELRCGKGFYVRSFARDLAKALGTVGHVKRLRRVRCGQFGLDGAVPQALLEKAAGGESIEQQRVAESLIPLREAIQGLPAVRVDEQGVVDALHGRKVAVTRCIEVPEGEAQGETWVVCDCEGEPTALATREEDGFRVRRGFRRVAVP